jgi:hypothetical protein
MILRDLWGIFIKRKNNRVEKDKITQDKGWISNK